MFDGFGNSVSIEEKVLVEKWELSKIWRSDARTYNEVSKLQIFDNVAFQFLHLNFNFHFLMNG